MPKLQKSLPAPQHLALILKRKIKDRALDQRNNLKGRKSKKPCHRMITGFFQV